MKKITLILIVLMGAVYSCSDDFLETEPDGNFISEDRISGIVSFDPSILDGQLRGIYATMIDAGSGGTDRADDVGHRGYDIMTDMMSNDMTLSGSSFGWYRSVTDYTAIQNFSASVNYMPWRFYYRIIFQSNSVLDFLGGHDTTPESEEDGFTFGQALALRAFAYFYLSQLYQTDYDVNEEILPIYTSAAGPDQPLSPMGDVFDLMESDLTRAIDLLSSFERSNPYELNEDIVRGILAYVYAAQGKYDETFEQAKLVADNNPTIVSRENAYFGGGGSSRGFNDINTPGFMWGLDITANEGQNLLSWWGQVDYYTYSYSAAGDSKSISDNLLAAMRSDDIRRNQFNPGLSLRPTDKFYNPDRAVFGTSSDQNEMDYFWMRAAEMHILTAEAAMKKSTPDEATARQYIKNITSQRVDDDSYIDALSGDALLKEILMQTRWELWGEGKSYLSMKRNDETRRRGTNTVLLPEETIVHDEPRLTFLIPQSERTDNPFYF